jgi:hypothetical protein
MSGNQSGKAPGTSVHGKGMRDRAAEPVDKSMKLGKASVNDEATRSGVAPTPKTLGERCA